MKKLFFLLIILFPIVANSATYNVTCSGNITSALNGAHTAASTGDTILVSSGSCTTSSTVYLSKGITLQGAGIGNTVITGSVMPMFQYASASPSANQSFRITGFSFNGNGIASYTNSMYLLRLTNYTGYEQTNVRVDHNRFYGASSSNGSFIDVVGVWGVIDNNTFETSKIPIRFSGYTSDANNYKGYTYWTDFDDLTFGAAANTMYIENNTFNGVQYQLSDSQGGNRYSYRYNTITLTAYSDPIWDIHGNYSYTCTPTCQMFSAYGGELYGNQITTSYGGQLVSVRGGKALTFFNNVTSSASWVSGKLREEIRDSAAPLVNGRVQHANTTYTWGNKKNLTTALSGLSVYENCSTSCVSSTCSIHADCRYNGAGVSSLLHNTQYWNYVTGYDGSSGMGCGTLANRPATCTEGTGYWATNQSCSDLTGMVGIDPATPISGTLYICGSNNWVDATTYTPYDFPHPLAGGGGESDTTDPILSAWFPTTEQTCSADPQTISIGITSTDANITTCKWDTSTGAYAALTNTFDGAAAGSVNHTDSASFACGATHTIYYACSDDKGNVTDTASYTFTLPALLDETTPVITSVTSAKQAVALTQKLSITTQIGASCRYCTDGVGGCSSATAWADRTAFSVTGGSTTHHEVAITQAASTSATYNVLCQNTQATATSTNSAITITTDAAKAITATGSLSITQGSGSLSVTILP